MCRDETKKGAQIARSAGASAQLVAKDGPYALIRLRSGQMRKVPQECVATIGEVSNPEHNLAKLGKAGAKRWRGVRPTVRGVAMNPVDHPHGGGEGKTSGGRHPVSPWGTPTKGFKTRSNKRTDHLIIKKRTNHIRLFRPTFSNGVESDAERYFNTRHKRCQSKNINAREPRAKI